MEELFVKKTMEEFSYMKSWVCFYIAIQLEMFSQA
jgi:hypothetical protein